MTIRNSHASVVLARGEGSRRGGKGKSVEIKPPKGEVVPASKGSAAVVPSTTLRRSRRERFLEAYPRGFYDPRHVQRQTRWQAHELWDQLLDKREFYRQIRREDFGEIVSRAFEAEAASKLLTTQERHSIRELLKTSANARLFGKALFDLLHGPGRAAVKFLAFVETTRPLMEKLPKGHAWPFATIFPFLANPDEHLLVRGETVQRAAGAYAFSLVFEPAPNWQTYARCLAFADVLKADLGELRPRDLIDVYCFIEALGERG